MNEEPGDELTKPLIKARFEALNSRWAATFTSSIQMEGHWGWGGSNSNIRSTGKSVLEEKKHRS